jgi:hypothetical protein
MGVVWETVYEIPCLAGNIGQRSEVAGTYRQSMRFLRGFLDFE